MNKLLRILQTVFIIGILLSPILILACIWDADTLDNEKKKKPEIAEIIFGTGKETTDAPRLQKRIAELKSDPRENDAAWWNDLAGAYLRLGQAQEAVNLLEPIVKKFDSDYGIHANLGTAYHLLGRYQEAEKEIARDLEINPNAHFGLEKFHLALLQYLSRDEDYQRQHVYVDEWTEEFFNGSTVHLSAKSVEATAEMVREDAKKGITNSFPLYFAQWNLAMDPKFEDGVLYMASLNPKQPACFTMLGILCLSKRDFNLATAAFEKAITLNSPQQEILQKKITEAKKYIADSRKHTQDNERFNAKATIITTVVLSLIFFGIFFLCRRIFKRRPRLS